MDIQIYHVPEKQLTIGVGSYDNEGPVVSGVDPLLQLHAFEHATREERATLNNCRTIKAFAKCHPEDEYDPKIGANIVRDKLIAKDATRTMAKMRIICEKLADALDGEIAGKLLAETQREENAQDRLRSHGVDC